MEQVPQEQPRLVHFDSTYVGHFRGKEEGRVPVWRTATLPPPPPHPRLKIGTGKHQDCLKVAYAVTSFHSHADEGVASGPEAQEET